jgi:hypothetical protein
MTHADAPLTPAGRPQLARCRFIILSGAHPSTNRELEAKVKALAGWKSYVTNPSPCVSSIRVSDSGLRNPAPVSRPYASLINNVTIIHEDGRSIMIGSVDASAQRF